MTQDILADLEAVRDKRKPVQGYLRRAVTGLVYLHGSGLPAGFVPAAAPLLDEVRGAISVLVGIAAYDAETADANELHRVLVLRSGLQYLIDDFRDTPAGDVIDPEALTELDGDLSAHLEEHGPVEPAPAGVPPSHWWWRGAG